MSEKWRTDIENAPKDGTTVLFPLEVTVAAYWDDELQAWITTRQLTLDHVDNPKRWRPAP